MAEYYLTRKGLRSLGMWSEDAIDTLIGKGNRWKITERSVRRITKERWGWVILEELARRAGIRTKPSGYHEWWLMPETFPNDYARSMYRHFQSAIERLSSDQE